MPTDPRKAAKANMESGADPIDDSDQETEAEDDPYAVLGLTSAASAEEVRQGYFRMVRRYPPESSPGRFKRIRAAYDALKSPLRRAQRELTQFDENALTVDLARLSRPGDEHPDFVVALLSIELGESEFALNGSSGFEQRLPGSMPADRRAGDLTPLSERDLLGPPS